MATPDEQKSFRIFLRLLWVSQANYRPVSVGMGLVMAVVDG